MAIKDTLGSGYVFPFELTTTGALKQATLTQLIQESIITILYWPKGVRDFNEDFGSRIEELLHEPLDSINIALVKHFVVEALTTYEKRIVIDSERTKVEVNDSEDGVILNLYYRVIPTNQVENLVFPFYKNI